DLARGGAAIETRTGHTAMPSADRVVRLDLDPSNFVIRETTQVGALVTDLRLYAGHDDRGLPATTYHTDYVMGGPVEVESVARLADGTVAAGTDEEGYTSRYTYDTVGQLRRATLDVGRSEPLAAVDVTPRSDCVSVAQLTV